MTKLTVSLISHWKHPARNRREHYNPALSKHNNRHKLIPVAFLFVHAFPSGRGKNRIHPVTGTLAITWDLVMSKGYMLLRTVTITLIPILTVYFGTHGAIAVLVMSP